MRIASKNAKALGFMGAVLGTCVAFGASAQTAAPAAVPAPAPATVVAAAGASVPTAASASAAAPVIAMNPAVPDAPKDDTTNLNALADKVSDSAKDAAKRLGSATGEVNLDDLNSARLAVAKIDALIDIEKRLVELDKVRKEHDRSSGGGVPMIPASAFGGGMPGGNGDTPQPMPMLLSASSVEVSRITGSEGNYAATLNTPDGQSKTVHVGDKLGDGSKVTAISATRVDLKQGGTVHHLNVKNVDMVHGHAL